MPTNTVVHRNLWLSWGLRWSKLNPPSFDPQGPASSWREVAEVGAAPLGASVRRGRKKWPETPLKTTTQHTEGQIRHRLSSPWFKQFLSKAEALIVISSLSPLSGRAAREIMSQHLPATRPPTKRSPGWKSNSAALFGQVADGGKSKLLCHAVGHRVTHNIVTVPNPSQVTPLPLQSPQSVAPSKLPAKGSSKPPHGPKPPSPCHIGAPCVGPPCPVE